ncbi:MAG: conjugal transfer protein TraN [Janthinobacterium lividum]
MIKRGVLAVMMCSLGLFASEQTYYDQGKGLASEQQQTGLPDHATIPGFQGTQLPETTLSPDSINSAAEQKLNAGHKSYETILQSQRERLSFHIDSKTDPLFTESDQIANNPLETLQAITSQRTTPVVEEKTRHTCEEPGLPYEMACIRDLNVTVTLQPSIPYTYQFNLVSLWESHKAFWHRHFQMGPGRNGSLDFGGHNKGGNASYGRHYTYVPNPARDGQFLSELFGVTGRVDARHQASNFMNWFGRQVPTQRVEQQVKFEEAVDNLRIKQVTVLPGFGHKSYKGQNFYLFNRAQIDLEKPVPPVITEAWISTCDLMEQQVDQGFCDRGEKICVSGPATRIINGVAVTKDCWQERQTYNCSYPARNTCGELKYRGCVQVGSRCSHQIGQTCVAYEQTYECTTRTGGETRDQFTGLVPWCLDGDCVDQGYAPNRDMAESLSKLMIFKEMQKNFNHLSIFKGKNLRCRRACVGFMNCCQKKSGWGISVGLSDCDDKEKELSALRAKDLCVYVGTYCSLKEPVTGTCLQKKSRYCCFDSKVARLVQEQGRTQLGLSFGSAETPMCRGFTIEELTRIDFEKIDLSSLFTELFERFQTPDVSKMSREFQQDLSSRIPKYGTDDTNHLKKLTEERDAHIKVGDKDVSAF